MIPQITQDGPNITERYWCSTCKNALPPPDGAAAGPKSDPWRFCPVCGEPIEYDKAQPVRWEEQNCTACGRPLIRRMGEPSPYFVATGDYVPGAPLCRTCLEKYCTQTNCLQCELGSWPGCRYVSIKQHMMRKVSEAEGEDDSDV